MQRGEPWLVRTEFLATDAFEACAWLGRCDGEPHVVGFGEIPLAIGAELESPDVIEAGGDNLDMITVE